MYLKSFTPAELYSYFLGPDVPTDHTGYLNIKFDSGRNLNSNTPLANIFYNKEENAYNLIIMAPGFSKSDFNINVSGKRVSVKATAHTPTFNSKWIEALTPEFRVESFDRSFTFLHELDAANVKAKYNDGLLNITLPQKNTKINENTHTINID